MYMETLSQSPYNTKQFIVPVVLSCVLWRAIPVRRNKQECKLEGAGVEVVVCDLVSTGCSLRL